MHATSHDGGTIRAASLVRVSTKGQADKGLSLDEQDRRVAKYISDQEWTPAGEYREPGVSGKRKDRPELDRLLADAEARLFDRVVVAKLDRLGRNFAHLVAVKERLTAAGVQVVCLEPMVDFSTPVGKLLWALLTAVAEFESDAIGARVAAVTESRARQGKHNGGPRPLGYDYAPDGGLIVNEAEAAIVRRIFHEYVGGKKQQVMQREFNDEGLTSKEGKRWHQGTISKILGSPLYKGCVTLKGEVYTGQPRAQVILDQRVDQRLAIVALPGRNHHARQLHDRGVEGGEVPAVAGDHLIGPVAEVLDTDRLQHPAVTDRRDQRVELAVADDLAARVEALGDLQARQRQLAQHRARRGVDVVGLHGGRLGGIGHAVFSVSGRSLAPGGRACPDPWARPPGRATIGVRQADRRGPLHHLPSCAIPPCQGSPEFPGCDHENSPPVIAGRSVLMASRWARMR